MTATQVIVVDPGRARPVKVDLRWCPIGTIHNATLQVRHKPPELAERFGLSRTNLSNHLACIRGCGLVVAVPEGRRVRYEPADRRLAHALTDLVDLALAVDPQAPCPVDVDGTCQ